MRDLVLRRGRWFEKVGFATCCARFERHELGAGVAGLILRRVLLSIDLYKYECRASIASGCKWLQNTAGTVYVLLILINAVVSRSLGWKLAGKSK